MATKETTNTARTSEKKEPVFTKSDLIESAAVFGTTPVLMTGALYGVKKETLTKAEAKAALDAFLKRPVKGEN